MRWIFPLFRVSQTVRQFRAGSGCPFSSLPCRLFVSMGCVHAKSRLMLCRNRCLEAMLQFTVTPRIVCLSCELSDETLAAVSTAWAPRSRGSMRWQNASTTFQRLCARAPAGGACLHRSKKHTMSRAPLCHDHLQDWPTAQESSVFPVATGLPVCGARSTETLRLA